MNRWLFACAVVSFVGFASTLADCTKQEAKDASDVAQCVVLKKNLDAGVDEDICVGIDEVVTALPTILALRRARATDAGDAAADGDAR